MSEKPVPAGKWKLRPYDPKCKTLVDPDPQVEDQIRCRVPLWTGDFGEVIPDVIAQGCRFDELPKLTFSVVGQFVIRAVQGGALRCGAVGTARHDVTRLQSPNPAGCDPPTEENWHASTARNLEVKPRRVLRFMLDNNARTAADKVTRQFIAHSLNLSIDDVQAAGEELRGGDRPLIISSVGCSGGWWLSSDGESVAEYCAPPAGRVSLVAKARSAG